MSLLGKTPDDMVTAKMVLGHQGDLQDLMFKCVASPEEEKEKLVGQVMTKTEQVNTAYGDNEFYLGYLSIIDFGVFFIFALLRAIMKKNMGAEFNDKFPAICKARMAFRELPRIKEFLEDPEHTQTPLAPPDIISFESNDY